MVSLDILTVFVNENRLCLEYLLPEHPLAHALMMSYFHCPMVKQLLMVQFGPRPEYTGNAVSLEKLFA